MRTVRSIRTMQNVCREATARGKRIGLVPTMGFLHEGHLSLVRRARKLSDLVVVTIFINPAQFAPNEDLKKYPRDERGDLRKIRDAGGDVVFIPKREDIYPDDYETYVTVEKLTTALEGASRPTHFRGVTTIVAKLFNITRPDVAVFGMKDYQQAIVLRQMTKDLGYPVKFVVAPTVREADGLAMSSRNKYFTPSQRTEARCLFFALRTAREMVKAGIADCRKIEKEMRAAIKATYPTAGIDYIAFTEFSTLRPVQEIRKDTIVSLAVKVHGVRLIDNMKLL
ncbi:MAG: pantoate--beta-alanine ligase [Candidatus Zixiibacteriota bacterium]|nr:MAG: pantoate--beta-alanine ligase [candidate division Zixibacteria bacterium]